MEFKKILLVGGTGYLGRHLTSFLKKSSCIDIFITGSKKSQQEGYFQIDFEQKEIRLRGKRSANQKAASENMRGRVMPLWSPLL